MKKKNEKKLEERMKGKEIRSKEKEKGIIFPFALLSTLTKIQSIHTIVAKHQSQE